MKRIVLPLTTLSVLFLTTAVLYGAGWITPRSQASHVPNHDQQPSEATLRYRHNGATHWRSCMMQP
jgi:hypothetical protein